MGTAVALGVGDGSALAVVGAAVARGVGDGSALAVVGAAVARGVGDGSALAVVGAAVVCPEDALPSGSLVARSEDGPSVGSSEPPQASNGRISARQRLPGKGVAFSSRFTSSVCWAAVGRAASPNTSTGGTLPAALGLRFRGECTTGTAVQTGALSRILRRGNSRVWGPFSQLGNSRPCRFLHTSTRRLRPGRRPLVSFGRFGFVLEGREEICGAATEQPRMASTWAAGPLRPGRPGRCGKQTAGPVFRPRR